MRKILIIIIFSSTLQLRAQGNLVPNHSFEDTVSCPPGAGASPLDFCANWFNPTMASPDYFNTCNGGVPFNDWGYQNAQDGFAYAGFCTYGGGNNYEGIPEYREYLEIELNEPLEPGLKYYWCMYVNLIDNVEYYSNNIGIAFHSDSLTNFGTQFQINAQIFDNWSGLIEDTNKWSKIGGSFVAEGGEKFLIIGNFMNDSQTEFHKWQTNILGGPYAYYCIDNVYIGTGICEIPVIDVELPNIFTPNNDGINDYIDFSLFKSGSVTIISRWGNTVLQMDIQSNFLWYGKDYKNEDLTEGVYYYVINYTENNTLKQKTGSIHLVR